MDTALGQESISMWPGCTTQEVRQYRDQAEGNPVDALKGAMCLGVWARHGEDFDKAGQDAALGLRLARRALEVKPDSPLAQYVTAALTGLWAERFPQQGLKAVPEIERLAKEAAQAFPELDHGGPDRLLGELYLRAPAFPVSIGDSALAVEHYEAAVALAPQFAPNRLGLARAFLEDEQTDKACIEYHRFLKLVDDGKPDYGETPPQSLRRACRE